MQKISVVTVTYNVESKILKTLDSIVAQDYRPLELVIKDGRSQDNTNCIIDSYDSKLRNRGIELKHIVSDDAGIYDAMNEAINYCDGEYVIFLNAGDCFYKSNTVSSVFNHDRTDDFIYGDTVFLSQNIPFLWKGNIKVIKDKCPFCHQSVFIRRNWNQQHLYDTSFDIAADYEFFYKSFKLGASFEYANTIIAVYEGGGKSGQLLSLDRKEHRSVQLRYNYNEERKLYRYLEYYVGLLSAYIQEFLFRYCDNSLLRELRRINKKRKMREMDSLCSENEGN